MQKEQIKMPRELVTHGAFLRAFTMGKEGVKATQLRCVRKWHHKYLFALRGKRNSRNKIELRMPYEYAA